MLSASRHITLLKALKHFWYGSVFTQLESVKGSTIQEKRKKKKACYQDFLFRGGVAMLAMHCIIQIYICAGHEVKGMHTNYSP